MLNCMTFRRSVIYHYLNILQYENQTGHCCGLASDMQICFSSLKNRMELSPKPKKYIIAKMENNIEGKISFLIKNIVI